jgi:hypothetical protein
VKHIHATIRHPDIEQLEGDVAEIETATMDMEERISRLEKAVRAQMLMGKLSSFMIQWRLSPLQIMNQLRGTDGQAYSQELVDFMREHQATNLELQACMIVFLVSEVMES